MSFVTLPFQQLRTKRLRTALGAAAAVMLMMSVASPASAQSTEPETETESTETETESTATETSSPQFQRVASSGDTMSSTDVYGDFWVRLLFTTDSDGHHVSVLSGLDRDTVTITNGSVVDFRNHPRHGHVKYYVIRPNDDATTVTVSVAAGTITDSEGDTNSAGSFSYTNHSPPLKATLSTTTRQPVLHGSYLDGDIRIGPQTPSWAIWVDVATSHDVLSVSSIEGSRTLIVSDDIKVSRGRSTASHQRLSSNGSFQIFIVSGTRIGKNFRASVQPNRLHHGSGLLEYVGWVTISIPAETFTYRGTAGNWNQPSNALYVWVGSPFGVTGESSITHLHESTASVGTWGVTTDDVDVTWSLTGDDSDDFTIDSNGQMSFASAPDHGNPTDSDTDNVYSVTVNALGDGESFAELVGEDYVAEVGSSYTATKDVTITVDKRPEVSTVTISSDAGDDDTYGYGDSVEVTVTFDEPVDVAASETGSGTYPLLGFQLGGSGDEPKCKTGTRCAGGSVLVSYDRMSGSNGLVFAYDVRPGDDDNDGISINANSLQLNGASITDVNGYSAVLDHDAVVKSPNHKVSAPVIEVKTFGIRRLASKTEPYGKGDSVFVGVEFTDRVTTATAELALTLDIGDTSREVTTSSVVEGRFLEFEYLVVAGDVDTDGISIDANSLRLNNGTITGKNGEYVSLDHDAAQAALNHRVSALSLSISSVRLGSRPGGDSDNTYDKDDKVQVLVYFEERVTVTGSPQLLLNIGGEQVVAAFDGHDHTVLVFFYNVTTGDQDTNGISIDANSLRLNGATITDIDGADVSLDHAAVADHPDHKVSAPRATVTSVEVLLRAGVGAATAPVFASPVGIGDTISVSVTFSEDVSLSLDGTVDNPTGLQLMLNIGGTQRAASSSSVSAGASSFIFRYTVVGGDVDTDGISIDADSLRLNDATLVDTDGVDVDVTHAAVPADISHIVIAPGGV